jgi:ABC-type Zn uptake system ZnuABC Zn-binding protein ZnuA
MELTEAHEGEEEQTGEQAHHTKASTDVWMDPNLVSSGWTIIEKTLIAEDPANQSLYRLMRKLS